MKNRDLVTAHNATMPPCHAQHNIVSSCLSHPRATHYIHYVTMPPRATLTIHTAVEMKLDHRAINTLSPCPHPSCDVKVKHGVCCRAREKHRRSSRAGPVLSQEFRRQLLRRSFGDDVVPGERRISPGAGFQQALCGAKSDPRLKKLLQDGRARIVGIEFSDPIDPLHRGFTDSAVEGDEDNLPTIKDWGQEILDGQRLDVRSVTRLSSVYAIPTQIIQQMKDGEKYELRDAYGVCPPLAENGLILWTGACHFEAMVTKVIS